ncbi:MAG TPA: S49 family peptidase [Candidatus Eisenbacteria bacterium]|nr:S49 family peptidase [Candidatus Eisenbacteria bacterium]
MKRARRQRLGVPALVAALAAAGVFVFPGPRALAWEGLAPYSEESSILATTPSTDDGAIGAIFNPAQWGVLERGEMSFFWSDENVRPNHMDNWGLSFGEGLGVSVRRRDARTPEGFADVTDWQIGMGSGTGDTYGGFAFGFSGPGKAAFQRENFLSFGSITRPASWLTYGTDIRFALSGGDIDGVADIGIRPLGDPRLLLFGDYSLSRGDRLDDGPLSGGVAIRPIPGLEAAARWREDDRVQVTFGINLQRTAFRAAPQYTSGDLGSTNYAIRFNPPQRGFDLDGRLNRNRRWIEMGLKGHPVYQAYRFGDKEAVPLLPLLERMQFAIDDPTVGGFIVDLSGYDANASMSFEIRTKLEQARRRGKKVVVYVDRLGGAEYYLASVADRVIMDPRGMLVMPGVQVSRTYLKGTLEKLGLGFEEWRYHRYKSALEALSRTDMSPADREQNQALVDAVYDEVASAVVSAGRAVSRDAFDRVVDEEPLLTAKRLQELRWVDAIGRGDDLRAAAKTLGRSRAQFLSAGTLEALRRQPDERWGPEPTVAVVYATGVCAMDEGIKGRATSKELRKYRKDRRVKAVVIRADSPGGDPLASDLVAGEIRALRKAGKTVIVSQGRVAASAGYWISMDADTILTTPFTVTGSIGVIGGWVWNKGFGDKHGMTSDHVQRGKSADLMGGLRIPLLGAKLPERNLTASEREQIRGLFTDLYDEFVTHVSSARQIPEARVREIAEGRVYMGREAIRLDLADRLGGLDDAIEAARIREGIPSREDMVVTQYPKPGLFRLPSFLAGMFDGREETMETGLPVTYETQVLQQLIDRPGEPLLLAPATLLPGEVEAGR